MRPGEALDTIIRALKQSAFDGGSYINYLTDHEGTDNRLSQPVVELQPVSDVRSDPHDTDRVGYVTNASGDRVGRIFQTDWQMSVQADIYIAAGNADLDVSVLGHDFRRALLPYDDKQQGLAFPDGAGGTIDDVTHFRVGDGSREDDLAGPGRRRWRHSLEIHYRDRVETTEETITAVDVPQTSDFTSDDGTLLEYTPQ